ncbi:MAG: hypothetical protein ACI3W5_06345 [Faecousia sp.]
MANNRKKSRWLGFWIFCLVLALVFMAVTIFLLNKFSGYLEQMDAKNTARENAQPELAIDAYLAGLDGDYVADRLDELYAQVDGNVQSEEELRALVKSELDDGIGYKLTFTSADKRTYALYSKKPIGDGQFRQIGEFSIAPNGEPQYGYAPWGMAEEYFNMDYLLTQGVTVTVPSDFTVWVDGVCLSEDYLVETGIEYPVLNPLKSLTPALSLPTKVTYRTNTSLGEVSVEIRDRQGSPVTIDENTDWNQFLHNCTPEQEADIQALMNEFMGHYIRFNSTRENCEANCRKVVTYMVPGGQLSDRMYKMLDGLSWTDPYEDEILSITYNHILALSDGRYVCDMTYVVNVIGTRDSVEETTHSQIVLVPVNGQLKVESIVNYKPQ